MPRSVGHGTFQLNIALEGITPLVWRRMLVSGEIMLPKLHDVFQAAMGWTNSHLHSFTVADRHYGVSDEDLEDEEIAEEDFRVLDVLNGQEAFVYQYDFGDEWDHLVEIEALTWSSQGLKHAVCLAGANACPPEDCGGVPGYEHLLAVLADPSDEEHVQLIEWIGGSFDASFFDVAATNAALQRIR